ncbi:MAG: transposase [Candidatus Thiodiazotropha sp. (ex Dulcina madagascariensis)]|nr:transposase [Candidatus Thiodiazotropha sp. (ex Epidulcina cf. delphinae)]MCU7937285.1 transposase [Candidatus Thiodiazotropha sp. (ex Dulcina madagascariensis)]
MPNYRRARVQGGTYFFTVVTHKRKPLFSDGSARLCLREAISSVHINYPFKIDAFCLLPDHLHTIWTLPEGDENFSKRWRAIKSHFSRRFREQVNRYAAPTGSRQVRGELTFWQRRFWEHLIRDENDFRRHLDYIHFNPVKHGYSESVSDWPWSTFHRYVNEGVYSNDWSGIAMEKIDLNSVGE